MRPRVIMVLAIATILVGGVLLVPTAYARLSDSGDSGGGGGGAASAATKAALTAPAEPTLSYRPVSVPGFKGSFFSWAILDRKTGKIQGAKNITDTNSTESMIKTWIVSDYLRQLGDKEPSAQRKEQARTALVNSNDDSAEALYNAGGREPVLDRMIKMCKLTDTSPQDNARWAYTQISAEDAVRLGECIKDGTAAGPKWTKWVLTEMTKVEGKVTDQQLKTGGGRWGIIDGLPKSITSQGPVSIKNGWTMLYADYQWHVNCLAITDKWVLAVLMRYPGTSDLIPDYGASVRASVATQLVTPEPGAALNVPKPLVKS